jgi:hypothetical protein
MIQRGNNARWSLKINFLRPFYGPARKKAKSSPGFVSVRAQFGHLEKVGVAKILGLCLWPKGPNFFAPWATERPKFSRRHLLEMSNP